MAFKFKVLSVLDLYGRYLIIVIITIAGHIVASESDYLIASHSSAIRVGNFFSALLGLLMFVYGIRIVEQLGKHGRIVRFLWYYLAVGFIVLIHTVFPELFSLNESTIRPVYISTHVVNGSITAFFLYVILSDIFSSPETHEDHIWGALTAYFMLLMLFAEFYEVLTLIQPEMLGEIYEIGWPNFNQCVVFSMNSLAGTDIVYPDANDFIRKIGTLENILGNLFLVVILGRLLSHPLKKKS